LAIPSGKGLFSILQIGFKYTDKNHIQLNHDICTQLQEFEALAKDLVLQPTHLAEIIPDTNMAIGSVDAYKQGMGGACGLSQIVSHSFGTLLSQQTFSHNLCPLITHVANSPTQT
jgi:hypothetical protein